jgi:glutamate/tyrosine decarboxylase-like PLP-dependent enzyme
MHSSIQKAIEVLGLGRDALRRVAVNADFQIDLAALKQAIAADRAAGHYPFCVIGNAGTVNTGAIDNLNLLADLCQEEGLWYHVDGAFGALAALAPALRPLVEGIDRADSIALDLHKWLYMPYEVGCILVRSAEAHRQSFTLTPDYLMRTERGLASCSGGLGEHGIQLSRRFRALKVWMSLKAYGLKKYGRLIQQNVDQAHHLVELIQAHPSLQLLAPAPLNIVCFRFVKEGLSESELERFNMELMMRLQEGGVVVLSSTRINGTFALRAAITNHRSQRQDIDQLVQEINKGALQLS